MGFSRHHYSKSAFFVNRKPTMIYLSTNARNGCIMDGGNGGVLPRHPVKDLRFLAFPLGLSLHDKPDKLFFLLFSSLFFTDIFVV